jgi:hypothetical protein
MARLPTAVALAMVCILVAMFSPYAYDSHRSPCLEELCEKWDTTADSGACRPPIPEHADHPFRACRPPVPEHADHLIGACNDAG